MAPRDYPLVKIRGSPWDSWHHVRMLCLLGATGSIGSQTLDLVSRHPDRYRLRSLAAKGSNPSALAELVREHRPAQVAIHDAQAQDALQGLGAEISLGSQALLDLVRDPEVDTVVVAVVGSVGLEPTLAALEAGKRVVLANKETLVAAGDLVREAIARGHGELIPADSEHVALHQLLASTPREQVANLYLTASGGPFRETPGPELARVTPAMALRHPTWSMGAKITIDSATMMNKGLEIIEAERLFGVSYDRIRVLVHPQSLVHGLLELADGTLLAQLSPNDMRFPIRYALDYPQRPPNSSGKRLAPEQLGSLDFEAPDQDKFPCLRLAYEAGRLGQTYPAVLAAADEIAVEAFLSGELGFLEIPALLETVLESHVPHPPDSVAAVQAADRWARDKARAAMGHMASPR